MKTQTITKSSENQKNVVCFFRVSTSKQENDRQFLDVRQYCTAFIGWVIVKEFEETVSGAAELSERTKMREFLEYVKTNPVDYVVVSELSRVGRSNLTLQIIQTLTELGICFISLKENLKTLNDDKSVNSTTQLIIDILNGINKFELQTITYRVKSGLRKTVSSGVWSGGNAPFGYSIVDKKLVINDESEAVKFMFTKYSEGWGTHRIASHLNINKILTKEGKTFSDPKIYKILSNSIYVGKRKWNNPTKKEPNRQPIIIEMPELRIVDDATFTSVQDKLTNRTNSTININLHQKYDYLLSNKIKCACGQNYIGQGRHNIYMCKSKKYAAGCNIKSVKIDWLDEEVKKRLMVNSGKLLFDNSGIINKTKEMQDEVIHLQEKIDKEKSQQNGLINILYKIGQKKFDEKFDASVNLVNELQKQIDELNIKLSNNKSFINFPPAIGIIDPSKEEEILNYNGTPLTMNIFNKVLIDKELVRKVIDVVNIDNETIHVRLINGKEFSIKRTNNSPKI